MCYVAFIIHRNCNEEKKTLNTNKTIHKEKEEDDDDDDFFRKMEWRKMEMRYIGAWNNIFCRASGCNNTHTQMCLIRFYLLLLKTENEIITRIALHVRSIKIWISKILSAHWIEIVTKKCIRLERAQKCVYVCNWFFLLFQYYFCMIAVALWQSMHAFQLKRSTHTERERYWNC